MNFRPMDIYAPEGTKVIYMAEHGRESNKEYADRYLTKGETYTVDHTDVYGFSSEVHLKEVPGKSFNTVMFKEADDAIDVDFTEAE